MGKRLRVLVGLSGGVDSSVTALLLNRAGFDVRCVFMKNWDPLDELGNDSATLSGEGGCKQQKEDWMSAELVARRLSLPLHSVDFTREYWENVFTPLLSGLTKGVTPNPDMNCNRFIKFGAFRRYAIEEMGFDCIATGHYAQISPPIVDPLRPLPIEHDVRLQQQQQQQQHQLLGTNKEKVSLNRHLLLPRLFSSIDAAKDQSDFLSTVNAQDLCRVILPIGGYTKQRVRSIAMEAGLTTAKRKDSYGICFVGKRPFADFVRGYLPPLKKAKFIDVRTGTEVEGRGGRGGETDISNNIESVRQPIDIETLTIGQCAKIPGAKYKWYVCATRFGEEKGEEEGGGGGGYHNEYNVAWVVNQENHPALFSTSAVVSVIDFNFISRLSLDSKNGGSAAVFARAMEYANERRKVVDKGATNLKRGDSSSFLDSDTKLDIKLEHPSSPPHHPRKDDCFVDELSKWLQSTDSLFSSSRLTERIPSMRVAFRDRHKYEDQLNLADATIVRNDEWIEACKKLLKPPSVDDNNYSDKRKEKKEFKWIYDKVVSSVKPKDSYVGLTHLADTETTSASSDLVLVLRFDTPRRAVTKGQVLVLYDPSQTENKAPPGIEYVECVESKDALDNSETTNGYKWAGAGLECIGGGPILAVGPSLHSMNNIPKEELR